MAIQGELVGRLLYDCNAKIVVKQRTNDKTFCNDNNPVISRRKLEKNVVVPDQVHDHVLRAFRMAMQRREPEAGPFRIFIKVTISY